MTTMRAIHLVCVLLLVLGGGCRKARRGPTPTLHEAVSSGDLKRVRSLIAGGANVNKKDDRGRTPLHMAADLGHPSIARLLINSGADVHADDEDLGTPLHHAAWNGHAAVVRCLIAGGAHVDSRNSRSRARPLDMAFVHRHIEVADLLLGAGSDVNESNERGTTLLHAAAATGHLEFVEPFLSRGAQIDAKDRKGTTPLHEAAWANRVEMAEFLLAKGAQVNASNERGETPLHVAAFNGYRELFDLLVAHGADIRAKDGQGRESHDCLRPPNAPNLVRLTGDGERPRSAIVTLPAVVRGFLQWHGAEFDRLWIPQPKDLEGMDLKAIIEESVHVETWTWFDRDHLLAHFTAFDQKYAGFSHKGRTYLLCNMELGGEGEELHDGFIQVADGGYCNTAMVIIDYAEKRAVRIDCEGTR